MKDTEIDAAIEHEKQRQAKLRKLLNIVRENERLERRFAFINGELSKEVTRITAIVAKHFNVSPDGILGISHREFFSVPRHAMIWLVRKTTGAPMAAIGQAVNRDHATIVHACQKTENRKSQDQKFAKDMSMLTEICSRHPQETNGNHK